MVMLQKRIEIGKIMEALQKKPFLPNPERENFEEESTLLNECLCITGIQEKSYWFSTYLSVWLGVAVVLTKFVKNDDYHDWEFPFGPITLTNITTRQDYGVMCTYQIYCICVVAAHFSTSDLVAAAVLAHISYQFKILQINIKNLINLGYREMMKELNGEEVRNISDNIDASTIPWKYLKKYLKGAVEYHLSIIDVARKSEDVFSGLLLVVFISNLGMLGSEVYRLSTFSFEHNDYSEIGEFVCTCAQVLIVCYWGEQVVSESQKVGNAVFEMDFIGADLRFQKGLILIIRRSQNPVTLTAKNFAIIGMSTFGWIMEKSYAAYAVMQKNHSE